MTESTTITVGSKFDSMAGVTADDSIDGDLTDGIKVEGTVDAGKVGDYKLVYSVSNSRGKTTTFTRTVHVQKKVVVPTAEANAASGKKNENASRHGPRPGDRGARHRSGRADRLPQEGGQQPIRP